MLNRIESIFGKPFDTIIRFGDFEQYKHRKYKEPVKGKGFRIVNATGKTGNEPVVVKLKNSLKTTSRKPVSGKIKPVTG